MNIRRFVTPVIASVVVVASALLAGVAGFLWPSPIASAGQAVPTVATASPTPEALNPELVRAQTVAAYGVFPLPVSVDAINRYHLTKKDLRGIKAAKELAATPHVRSIRECESSNDYRSQDRQYYGAYQFLTDTWLSNGGGRFADRADHAPAWAQDYIMYRTYEADGWGQWACA